MSDTTTPPDTERTTLCRVVSYAKTAFYWLLALTCFTAFIVQATDLVVEFMKGPLTTAVESEVNEASQLSVLTVCCKAIECYGSKRKKPLSKGVLFARGYWIRQSLTGLSFDDDDDGSPQSSNSDLKVFFKRGLLPPSHVNSENPTTDSTFSSLQTDSPSNMNENNRYTFEPPARKSYNTTRLAKQSSSDPDRTSIPTNTTNTIVDPLLLFVHGAKEDNVAFALPSFGDMEAEMREMKITDVREYLTVQSDLRALSHDFNIVGSDIGLAEKNTMKLPSFVGGLINSKSDMVCLRLEDLTRHYGAQQYKSRRLTADGKMTLTQTANLVYALQAPSTYIMLVTLYNGPQWYHLPSDTFMKYIAVTHEKPHAYLAYYTVTIQKTTKLQNYRPKIKKHDGRGGGRKGSCKPTPKNTKYPDTFAQYRCEMECEMRAYEVIYGCSWVRILRDDHTGDHLPYCNQWVQRTYDDDVQRNITSFWKQCVTEKHCEKQRYCTSWFMNYQYTAMRGPIFNENFTETVTRFKIQVAPHITHIRERLLMTREQLAGSVGGLLGMWIGLSVFSIAHNLCQVMCKKFHHEDKSGDKDVEGGDRNGNVLAETGDNIIAVMGRRDTRVSASWTSPRDTGDGDQCCV